MEVALVILFAFLAGTLGLVAAARTYRDLSHGDDKRLGERMGAEFQPLLPPRPETPKNARLFQSMSDFDLTALGSSRRRSLTADPPTAFVDLTQEKLCTSTPTDKNDHWIVSTL